MDPRGKYNQPVELIERRGGLEAGDPQPVRYSGKLTGRSSTWRSVARMLNRLVRGHAGV